MDGTGLRIVIIPKKGTVRNIPEVLFLEFDPEVLFLFQEPEVLFLFLEFEPVWGVERPGPEQKRTYLEPHASFCIEYLLECPGLVSFGALIRFC